MRVAIERKSLVWSIFVHDSFLLNKTYLNNLKEDFISNRLEKRNFLITINSELVNCILIGVILNSGSFIHHDCISIKLFKPYFYNLLLTIYEKK